MTSDWQSLETELRQWRAARLELPIWWRDDDAVAVTPALDRLTALAQEVQVPCHLAVIPKHATVELVTHCSATPLIVPMVHGYAHLNHAPAGKKKAEFGHERTDLATDAERGLQEMRSLFRHDFLQCFVPPWNRIASALVPELPNIGYDLLSTFTPRTTRLATPGLVQINTHVDPINWRGGGGLMDVQRLLAQSIAQLQDRRQGRTDCTEPLGLLTHHLVQDEAVWRFVERYLGVLLDGGATPVNLFNLKDNLP